MSERIFSKYYPSGREHTLSEITPGIQEIERSVSELRDKSGKVSNDDKRDFRFNLLDNPLVTKDALVEYILGNNRAPIVNKPQVAAKQKVVYVDDGWGGTCK